MEDRELRRREVEEAVSEERLVASSASYSPSSYMPHSDSNGTNITNVLRYNTSPMFSGKNITNILR